MIKVIVSKSVIGTCCVVDNDDGEMVMIDEITPIIRPIETKKRCSYKITFFIFDLLKPIALITESSLRLSKTLLAIIIPTPSVPTRTPSPPKTLKIEIYVF